MVMATQDTTIASFADRKMRERAMRDCCVVFAKWRDLVLLAAPATDARRTPPPASFADTFALMLDDARRAVNAPGKAVYGKPENGPDGRGREPVAAALAGALIDFTAAAAPLMTRLLRAAPYTAEPREACREADGAAFWRFAALVQDIWEHAFDAAAQARDEEVVAYLERTAPLRMLDFGAGAGFFAVAGARAGTQAECVEANPFKRRFLTFLARRAAPGHIVMARRDAPPAPMALAIDVLDHLEDPVAGIGELARRVVPGGVLVAQAAFAEDGWHQPRSRWARPVHAALHTWFRPEFAGRTLSNAGVIVLRRRARANRAVDAPLADDMRLRLEPSVTLAPYNGGYVAAAPRFYVEPLHVAETCLPLIEACRRAPAFGALKDDMRRFHISAEDSATAVAHLRAAGLVAAEAA